VKREQPFLKTPSIGTVTWRALFPKPWVSWYSFPMAEIDYELAVASIRKSLATSPLDWVLREVNETLRLGKPAVRTIEEAKEESTDAVHYSTLAQESQPRKQTRRKTKVPSTEAYSTKEELVLLLDSIERTAIATMDMQAYVIEDIAQRQGLSAPNLNIVFERDGQLSSPSFHEKQSPVVEQVTTLRHAIAELRSRAR